MSDHDMMTMEQARARIQELAAERDAAIDARLTAERDRDAARAATAASERAAHAWASVSGPREVAMEEVRQLIARLLLALHDYGASEERVGGAAITEAKAWLAAQPAAGGDS